MVNVKHEKPRGVLGARPAEALMRYWPSADLAPFVEHFWVVRWNVSEAQTAETLPHPSVHLVLESGRSEVVGVMRGRFTRVLEGAGRVIGTKFLPGAFRAFIDHPVVALTDRSWTLRAVFGSRAGPFDAEALAHDDDGQAIAVIETFLRSFRPEATEAMMLAGRIAARIAEERRITKVDQIVEEFAVTARQMQRLFREYIGVTPKWVIQRYRLIEASERLAAGADLSGLAHDLGYSDQAHFIRDFKKLVGTPPAGFARRLQR